MIINLFLAGQTQTIFQRFLKKICQKKEFSFQIQKFLELSHFLNSNEASVSLTDYGLGDSPEFLILKARNDLYTFEERKKINDE